MEVIIRSMGAWEFFGLEGGLVGGRKDGNHHDAPKTLTINMYNRMSVGFLP